VAVGIQSQAEHDGRFLLFALFHYRFNLIALGPSSKRKSG
jgi:hypothetical protein